MPRKIGYGDFTPARAAALKKAQLASARARRKHNSEVRKPKRKAKAEERVEKKSRKKQLANAAAMAAAVGFAAYNTKKAYDQLQELNKDRKANAQGKLEFDAMVEAEMAEHRARSIAKTAREAELKQLVGDINGFAENQEQWDARVELYGEENMLGEYNPVFGGRPEIWPTLPRPEMMKVFHQEAITPSWSLEQDDPDADHVILYHRTGGVHGTQDDGAAAKAKILADQEMKVLNRDENAVNYKPELDVTWWSNKLNDSNTREAFGEHVIRIKLPKSALAHEHVGQSSFGVLSPIKEVWAVITPEVLKQNGVVFEDVLPEEITPKVERKFRVSK